MNKWFKVDLGDAMLATKLATDIEAKLLHIYEMHNKPSNMLAVYRHESKGMHCHLIVYLTLAFQQSAFLDGALGCGQPPMMDSSFLAGNKDGMKV